MNATKLRGKNLYYGLVFFLIFNKTIPGIQSTRSTEFNIFSGTEFLFWGNRKLWRKTSTVSFKLVFYWRVKFIKCTEWALKNAKCPLWFILWDFISVSNIVSNFFSKITFLSFQLIITIIIKYWRRGIFITHKLILGKHTISDYIVL